MSGTYNVNIQCDNCDFEGQTTLPRGTPVSHSMTCPNCGCKSAHKQTTKIVPFPRPRIPPPNKPLPWTDEWNPPPTPYKATQPSPYEVRMDVSTAPLKLAD